MAKVTRVNSPTPFNVSGAARAIGCADKTIREYIRTGQLDGVQRMPSGQVVLYEPQVEQARTLYQSRRRRTG
jgi:predicted site-specific integrase-resolvase